MIRTALFPHGSRRRPTWWRDSRWSVGAVPLSSRWPCNVAVGFTPVCVGQPGWAGVGPHHFHNGGRVKQVTMPTGRNNIGAKTEIACTMGAACAPSCLNTGEALFDVEHDRSVLSPSLPAMALSPPWELSSVCGDVGPRYCAGCRRCGECPAARRAGSVRGEGHEVSAIRGRTPTGAGTEVTYRAIISTPVESEDSRVATEWLDGRANIIMTSPI